MTRYPADELSDNWVTVRYNEEKLLNFLAVRRAEMIVYQLEDAMKCGPKPKDKTEATATSEEQPVR